MTTYRVVPGRRAGDGWLVATQTADEPMSVIQSFPTWAEAQAEAARLSDGEEEPQQKVA